MFVTGGETSELSTKPLSSIDFTPEVAINSLNRIFPPVSSWFEIDHVAGHVGGTGISVYQLDRVDVVIDAPSLGVVSVTMTSPGPWTVMVQ